VRVTVLISFARIEKAHLMLPNLARVSQAKRLLHERWT